MSVYRFRITFEDYEEVSRDIEIKSTQHFEDFHYIILQSIGFDTIHTASFFISDDYWRKGDEIALKVDDAANAKRKKDDLVPVKLMSKCKLASLIDDPHQKFVYVYDPTVQWTLLVELIKILPDDAAVTYPRISKSVDDAPRQYPLKKAIAVVEEDDEPGDIEAHTDEEAYIHAHADEDVEKLEGVEGEVETEEELEEEDDMEASDFEEHIDEKSEED